MKSKLVQCLPALAGTILALFFVFATSAQTTLFSDNFQDGDQSGWSRSGGTSLRSWPWSGSAGRPRLTRSAYTAWPDRLYVIDAEGRIVYKSRPGPFGFKIEPVAEALAGLAGPAVKPPRPS